MTTTAKALMEGVNMCKYFSERFELYSKQIYTLTYIFKVLMDKVDIRDLVCTVQELVKQGSSCDEGCAMDIIEEVHGHNRISCEYLQIFLGNV